MSEHTDVQRALEAAAAADDRAALWDALEPLRAHLTERRDVAALWVEALRTSPQRRSLLEEAEAVLDRWPGDPGLVGGACDALIRAAERRPIDEPPLAEGPASAAASGAARCLGKLPAEAKADPEIGGRLHALRGNALSLLGPKRHADAVAALERALALDPDRGQWLFDLGLAHKRARDFAASLEATQRARAALGDAKPVLWNLAIAATALGRAALALEAWRALGLPASGREGALPFVEGLEPAQIRLPTLGSGHAVGAAVPDEAAGFEIVWVQPLSPCHGVVRSPTFREAMADFGDVVLWDGAPASVARVDGRPVPRFPFLGVLRQGDERRFRFLAMQQREGQVEALGEDLPEGAILYRLGERVETVCPRCAAGDTLVKHDHLPAEEHRVAFGKLVLPASLPLADFARALDEARARHPGVLLAVPGLYEALGDTPQAGKHHKRWGTIERVSSP
ncbi:MAG TPA: hypothetical protein RMH99_28515 [Sandaracinaceae bacterium LLY-WYZ-13_1]|nr:hypothetical protein [Sandaracinaceae bacterium LLY-WYZ-13_1]